MTYSVEYDEQAGWVVLSHWDETPIAELEIARSRVNAMLEEHGCHKLLVDASRVTQRLSTFEYYDFATSNPVKLPVRVRIAMIVPPDRIDDGRFVENVLVNRGMTVRVFADRAEGVAWLAGTGS